MSSDEPPASQPSAHLDWYAVDPDGTRRDYGTMDGIDAHDHWAVPRRLREVFACRDWAADRAARGSGDAPSDLTAMPRPEKNLLAYLALASTPNAHTVMELGSSIYELYDGLIAARASLPSLLRLPLLGYHYQGIEISPFMCRVAEAIHPEIRLSHYPSVGDAPASFDFLYDRAVSSFAFTSAAECAAFLNRSQVALLNLFVSRDETFEATWGGEKLTYFALEELLAELEQPLWHLFGERSPGAHHRDDRDCVEGFFLLGRESVVEEFETLGRQSKLIRDYFDTKGIRARPAQELLREVSPVR